MLRMTYVLMLLTVAPALAQDYTIVAISHTDNKVSELDPLTGETLREFVVPGEWFGETHEGAVSPDGRTIYVSVPYAKQVIILDLDTFAERGAIESDYFSRPPQVRGFARIGRRESTSSDPHGVALNNDGSKLPRFKGSSQQHRVEGGFLRPRFHWTIDWRGRRGPDRGGS